MSKTKIVWFVSIVITAMWCCISTPPVHSRDGSLKSRVLAYAGKSYTGTQDASYLAYDLALRDYMVNRIKRRFGVALDPKTYSGLDLVEIESFFKCKKSEEPFDEFLKMFPKYP